MFDPMPDLLNSKDKCLNLKTLKIPTRAIVHATVLKPHQKIAQVLLHGGCHVALQCFYSSREWANQTPVLDKDFHAPHKSHARHNERLNLKTLKIPTRATVHATVLKLHQKIAQILLNLLSI